jgi:hypothetical protein
MSTSISTPASLATFPQPHASTSKVPHVTLSPVEGGEGNASLAVAAVQGDGVWTYDVGCSCRFGLISVANYETLELVHCSTEYFVLVGTCFNILWEGKGESE